MIAGYISYAFHRVGEVTDDISGIDRIMGMGFNWAPPSVLVDTMGLKAAIQMIEKAGLPVPPALADAARGQPKRFFDHPQVNVGKFFVAALSRNESFGEEEPWQQDPEVYVLGGYQTDFARNWTKENKHFSR